MLTFGSPRICLGPTVFGFVHMCMKIPNCSILIVSIGLRLGYTDKAMSLKF